MLCALQGTLRSEDITLSRRAIKVQLRKMRDIFYFITHNSQGGHVHLGSHHLNLKVDQSCLRCATLLG